MFTIIYIGSEHFQQKLNVENCSLLDQQSKKWMIDNENWRQFSLLARRFRWADFCSF